MAISFAVSCGGEIEHKTVIKSEDTPPVVADAPVMPVSTDPPVIPASLVQPSDTPIERVLPNPNEDIQPFGFTIYSGDTDVVDSTYNNLGPDSNPLSKFRDTHYSLDDSGLKAVVDAELIQAFVNDTKQSLENVLTSYNVAVTDQSVNDLGNYVLRSFYDGTGYDVRKVYLADPGINIGSTGDILFDLHNIVGNTDSQVLAFRNLPYTYTSLISKLAEQEDNAFGGQ